MAPILDTFRKTVTVFSKLLLTLLIRIHCCAINCLTLDSSALLFDFALNHILSLSVGQSLHTNIEVMNVEVCKLRCLTNFEMASYYWHQFLIPSTRQSLSCPKLALSILNSYIILRKKFLTLVLDMNTVPAFD